MVTGTDASATNRSLVAAAKVALQERRDRDKLFADHVDGFGEPAWDMLLALFIAQGEGRRWVSCDRLIAEIPVPSEIARPYITWLCTHDLAQMRDGTAALAARGRELMAIYLDRDATHNLSD